MSQFSYKNVRKVEDKMELEYVLKRSRFWKNEVFNKNNNYDLIFLLYEYFRVYSVVKIQ